MDAKAFDGEAISRADREFLESLEDHPLKRNPLYGAPRPPKPDFGDPKDKNQDPAREAFHAQVVIWMLVNYAYREGAFMGRDGAISLVDGEIISIAGLRGRMAPWAMPQVGKRGGLTSRSPVEDWMASTVRISVRREEMRPDQPRPIFTEDGYNVFNRYRPPAHPTTGGDTAAFHVFLAHLFPIEEERRWYWNYLAHKVRRPWIPMIAVFMVAEEFGSGRGTMYDILGLLFGKEYVAPCTFGELTGRSAGARFNARMADALFLVVNEAVAEDGEQQSQRRIDYEGLKNAIEPSPTARRRFEAKGQHAYAQTSCASINAATNHRDVVKLPRDDRRVCVPTCGKRMTEEQTKNIRAWMASPENIGALYRELLNAPAVPTAEFNPFDNPPPFAGRLEMIGMGRSKLEDAYDAAIEALEGCPLFTMPQAQRLISHIAGGAHAGGGDLERARHTVAKNAYRLRQRDEPNNRIRYHKRPEVIYARTRAERQRWREAETALIIKQLDRAEERIVQAINAEHDDVFVDIAGARANDPDPLPESDK
jgi:Family of unknown function (DUF5906)